jgi:hypothetical protein
MKVTRTSVLSGITRTRELDVTPEQLKAWEDGALIQNVMRHLNHNDREFIMTGATSDEWNKNLQE